MPDFVAPRRGLRLPQSSHRLRRPVLGHHRPADQCEIRRPPCAARSSGLAGEKIGDMRAHPTPERVADISVAALHGAALFPLQGAISDRRGAGGGRGRARHRKPAATARPSRRRRNSPRQRGIGTWTARYVLMRGGFADAAPVGDSALATALQRLHKLPERPDTGRDRRADGAIRAPSQPRHHASVDLSEGSRHDQALLET